MVVTIQAPPVDDPPRIGGVTVTLTRELVGAIARRALMHEGAMNRPPVSWYIPLDVARVPAGWLVTGLTRLAMGRFRTAEACRLLAQLGIEPRRI